MVLVSKLSKDIEKIVLKTDFDPVNLKTKIDFYLERRRISQEEYDYLLQLMEQQLDASIQKEVDKL